jgi:2-dehydro-3-deoxygluconokinase
MFGNENAMNTCLKIPAKSALVFISLCALIRQMNPGVVLIHKATECHIHVSSGSLNDPANLADSFGLQTGIVTAMVDYPISESIDDRIWAMGVKPVYKQFTHNGVNGPDIATLVTGCGQGVWALEVLYNRANEATAQLKPGDFEWNAIFTGGVRWFHRGGLFVALSDPTDEQIIEAMRAVKAAGGIVSFDLKYHPKFWIIWGGGDKALSLLSRIVEQVEVLVGNDEDLQFGLVISGLEISTTSKLD